VKYKIESIEITKRLIDGDSPSVLFSAITTRHWEDGSTDCQLLAVREKEKFMAKISAMLDLLEIVE